MGFRFQKRIKIAPGVHLNISKGGISTSVGKRGASVTIGKRGIRANVGIPGTGISYSEQLTGKRTKRATTPVRRTTATTTNPDAANEVDAYNAYVNMLISLHQETIEPVNWNAHLDEDLSLLSVRSLHTKNAQRELEAFEPTWMDRMLNRSDAKKRELEEHLSQAILLDEKIRTEKLELLALATGVLQGDEAATFQALNTYHAFEQIEQFGNKVNVQVKNEELTIYLQIGDEETVPTEVVSLTAKGNLTRKNMVKTNYFALYQDYVCSCVLAIARSVLAISPTYQVVIHVYDKSQADEPPIKGCILSTRVTRDELSNHLFEIIDCSKTIETFEHHMNHLKTKGFRLVDELE
ncbi:DUF4236 domain-containing protein [Sporosarcina sp. A2]|uniref:DUF4236 domain-containing protein n=1 Tax=Sporosarcina sp. A2 TaxID=3393449 RepID=UPI003D7BECBD